MHGTLVSMIVVRCVGQGKDESMVVGGRGWGWGYKGRVTLLLKQLAPPPLPSLVPSPFLYPSFLLCHVHPCIMSLSPVPILTCPHVHMNTPCTMTHTHLWRLTPMLLPMDINVPGCQQTSDDNDNIIQF